MNHKIRHINGKEDISYCKDRYQDDLINNEFDDEYDDENIILGLNDSDNGNGNDSGNDIDVNNIISKYMNLSIINKNKNKTNNEKKIVERSLEKHYFTLLPNEIWIIIFKYLNYDDLVNLLNLGNVNKNILFDFIELKSREYWHKVYLGHLKNYFNSELNMIRGAIENYGILQIIGSDLGVVNYSDFDCFQQMQRTEYHVSKIFDNLIAPVNNNDNDNDNDNKIKNNIEKVYLELSNFENKKAIQVIIDNFPNKTAKCIINEYIKAQKT
jgi:hypothetical protein